MPSSLGLWAIRWGAVALFGLAWVGGGAPANAAWTADPGLSSVSVQAPVLAPGVWGSAPVSGQLAPSGAFSLSIQGAQASTGSAMYDAVVRRALGPISVQVPAARLVARQGVVDRYAGLARVGVAGRVVSAPLSFRVTRLKGRRVLNAFVVASLDAHGIRALSGGPAGPLRASVRVSFPTP